MTLFSSKNMLTRGSSSGPFWNREASLSLSKIQMVVAATQDKTVVSDGARTYLCNHKFILEHWYELLKQASPRLNQSWLKDTYRFKFTSSIIKSIASVLARSLQCSMTICKALIIMFSISSVVPDDSRSLALSRGKQKEKAGAESGAMSKEGKKKAWFRTLVRFQFFGTSPKYLNYDWSRHNPLWNLFCIPYFLGNKKSLALSAHRSFWSLSGERCGCAGVEWSVAQLRPGPPAPRPHLDRMQVSAAATSHAQQAQLEKENKT